jgi:Asp-tRNA(Asn)/Glu-tRNA(Gln) amidotransferase A subunit family amidase
MSASAIPTIAEAARLIAARAVSPVELTEACLARAKRLDHLAAFIRLTEESALQSAHAAEREIMASGPRGPLHGIPIALKDIIETKGITTTAHSRHLLDHVPMEDAAVTERLAAAGTVMLGKLATHEFALGGPSFDLPFPPARNPWDPTRFTGGSSSGAGAAVAAGLALGALGSDTGGSIRTPAAFCGIAGLKPTYGRVSRYGVLPLAFSLDHVGPMAWTAEDCAILLQAIAGHDPRDPASADLPVDDYRAGLDRGVEGLRIGVVRHFFVEDHPVSAASLAAIDRAILVLRELGAEVRDIALSPLADWYAAGQIIMLSEGYTVHEARLQHKPEDYGALFHDRIVMGAFISAADYIQAQRRRRELRDEMLAIFGKVDLVLTASAPGEAPSIDGAAANRAMTPSHNTPFNVAGIPAISLSCGFGEAGLPLAFQLAARPFAEASLLRAAHGYERATEWRRRRPAEPALAAGAPPVARDFSSTAGHRYGTDG